MQSLTQPGALIDYEARVQLRASRMRSDAASAIALVREVARIVRWFGSEQPDAAIGPRNGIVSDGAFYLYDDSYQLRALAHTAVGKPALQLVSIGRETYFTERDTTLFTGIVGRVSREKIVTAWEDDRSYSVAIDVPVHPSLIRAISRNHRRFEGCDDVTSHTGIFVVPVGWHR